MIKKTVDIWFTDLLLKLDIFLKWALKLIISELNILSDSYWLFFNLFFYQKYPSYLIKKYICICIFEQKKLWNEEIDDSLIMMIVDLCQLCKNRTFQDTLEIGQLLKLLFDGNFA